MILSSQQFFPAQILLLVLDMIDVKDDDNADHTEDVSHAEGDDEDGGDEEQEVEVLKLIEIRVIKAQPMQQSGSF